MKTVTIEIIRGSSGVCIRLNGHHIGGPRPWGNEITLHRWEVDAADIIHTIGGDPTLDAEVARSQALMIALNQARDDIQRERPCGLCAHQEINWTERCRECAENRTSYHPRFVYKHSAMPVTEEANNK